MKLTIPAKKNANNNLKRKPRIRLKYRKKPFNKHSFTQNDKKDLNEKEKKKELWKITKMASLG